MRVTLLSAELTCHRKWVSSPVSKERAPAPHPLAESWASRKCEAEACQTTRRCTSIPAGRVNTGHTAGNKVELLSVQGVVRGIDASRQRISLKWSVGRKLSTRNRLGPPDPSSV